jgi:hypothetical protein
VPEHSHRAIQVVISLEQPVAVRGHGEERIKARGIVVRCVELLSLPTPASPGTQRIT